MIKKLVLIAVFLMALSGFCFGDIITTYDYAGSGSVAATVNIAASSYRSIAIEDIWAMSDLSTSVVKIYIGAAAGTTDNYTQILQYDLGDNSTLFQNNGKNSLLVLPKNYQARVVVDSTAANSLAVNWQRL
jgi:hypothetical protein